jgi:polyphosphate kinase 2 (PPK2 family)
MQQRGIEVSMSTNSRRTREKSWIEAELEDSLDEELEMELDDERIPRELRQITGRKQEPAIDRRLYFHELLRLQSELVKLQDWVVHTKYKLVVIFEGRDAAGKGGVIKRITQRLNPRACRVVALPAPSDREKTQWYFQRYVSHLPIGGEIVLFDRSWYNRAGVERVMGFATPKQVDEFFHDVPEFERMLVRSGIKLVKYWFSINIPEARWWVVEGNDKKRARLNCIHHLLQQVAYEETPHEPLTLPKRVFDSDYERKAVPDELCVPEIY